MDGGFWYSIPAALTDRVEVGSIVRVPLSGRRVRGFVVELDQRDPHRLRDIAQVSGRSRVFDDRLLGALTWASAHYVAPVGPMLERSAPPNVPPGPPRLSPKTSDRVDHPLSDLVDRALERNRNRPVVLLDGDGRGLAALAQDGLAADVSTVVIAPTAKAVARIADTLETYGIPVHRVSSEMVSKDITSSWRSAHHVATVLVGTPKIVTWGFHTPAILYVVEESRRAMKDRQAPTIAVRDVVLARIRREQILAIFAGPTPSAEMMGTAPEVRRLGGGRLWPLVEVVDRRDDASGGGPLSMTTKQAIKAIAAQGTVFVYANRRGYAAASRCVACRTLRVCPTCGSRPDSGDACLRCGHQMPACLKCGKQRFEPLGAGVGRLIDEISRVVDASKVGEMSSRRSVRVGTERDLNSLADFDLTVLADADGLIRGSNYRSAEEALRIGARLARSVRPGGRLLVQTSDPEHHAIVGLRRADPIGFHEIELQQRQTFGYPPTGELMVIEARDLEDPEIATAELVAIADDAMVMGPTERRAGVRWFIQAPNLDRFKRALRPIAGKWRDNGASIRIDADPIDL